MAQYVQGKVFSGHINTAGGDPDAIIVELSHAEETKDIRALAKETVENVTHEMQRFLPRLERKGCGFILVKGPMKVLQAMQLTAALTKITRPLNLVLAYKDHQYGRYNIVDGTYEWILGDSVIEIAVIYDTKHPISTF